VRTKFKNPDSINFRYNMLFNKINSYLAAEKKKKERYSSALSNEIGGSSKSRSKTLQNTLLNDQSSVSLLPSLQTKHINAEAILRMTGQSPSQMLKSEEAPGIH